MICNVAHSLFKKLMLEYIMILFIINNLLYMAKLHGKNLSHFLQFSLNGESFPANHDLVDQEYKSTKCYSKNFL